MIFNQFTTAEQAYKPTFHAKDSTWCTVHLIDSLNQSSQGSKLRTIELQLASIRTTLPTIQSKINSASIQSWARVLEILTSFSGDPAFAGWGATPSKPGGTSGTSPIAAACAPSSALAATASASVTSRIFTECYIVQKCEISKTFCVHVLIGRNNIRLISPPP